jgi:hypothetical protein
METGKTLLIIGILLLLAGALLIIFPKLFNWFGQLPGDIKILRENSRIYIPITSMILLSVGATFLVNIILWIISKIG